MTEPTPLHPAAAVPARQPTAAETSAEAEAHEPREEKIKRLIAAYEHGLASNGPRTSAELAEIKALLEG